MTSPHRTRRTPRPTAADLITLRNRVDLAREEVERDVAELRTLTDLRDREALTWDMTLAVAELKNAQAALADAEARFLVRGAA